MGSGDGQQPQFLETFSGATNLTSIPSTLFSQYTTGALGMFAYTFNGCTGLTSIPAELFSNITTEAYGMFRGTFAGCTNLGCETVGCSTGTGYIPSTTFAGLVANGHPTAIYMWLNIFADTKLVTSCPAETVEYITGYEEQWGGKVSCKGNNTIFLQWTIPENEGISGGTDGGESCIYGEPIVLPANPTKRGYTFTGWRVVKEEQ